MKWYDLLSPRLWSETAKYVMEIEKPRGTFTSMGYEKNLSEIYKNLEGAYEKLKKSNEITSKDATNYLIDTVNSMSKIMELLARDSEELNDLAMYYINNNGNGKNLLYSIVLFHQTSYLLRMIKEKEIDSINEIKNHLKPFVEHWKNTVEKHRTQLHTYSNQLLDNDQIIKYMQESMEWLDYKTDQLEEKQNDVNSSLEEKADNQALKDMEDQLIELISISMEDVSEKIKQQYETRLDDVDEAISENSEAITGIHKNIAEIKEALNYLSDDTFINNIYERIDEILKISSSETDKKLGNYVTGQDLKSRRQDVSGQISDMEKQFNEELKSVKKRGHDARKRWAISMKKRLQNEYAAKDKETKAMKKKEALDEIDMPNELEWTRYWLKVDEEGKPYAPWYMKPFVSIDE